MQLYDLEQLGISVTVIFSLVEVRGVLLSCMPHNRRNSSLFNSYPFDSRSALIAFTEDESIEQWKGFFYAVLMFGVSQIQSLIRGQYFAKTFQVGLRIRTGIIAAVYKKVSTHKRSADA